VDTQQSLTQRRALPDDAARTLSIDRTALGLVLVALVVYSPAIVWGLPYATSELRMLPWGSDELAPIGPLAQVWHVVFHGGAMFDPRYPLLPYLIQTVFMAPYLAWLEVTGGLTSFSTEFPYGLTDPVGQLAALTVVARMSSLFMAAVVPAVAYLTVRRLTDGRTALLAGVFVLLLYPLFYYSRTSNVDVGGLMWLALGLWALSGVVRDGLTRRNAVALGVFAALATATKDQNYAIFVAIGLSAVALHIASSRATGRLRAAWVAPVIGLATAIAVYVVATGLVFRPEAFVRHVRFIIEHPSEGGGSGQSYYSTPATLAGYASLVGTYVRHIVDSMGLPMAVAGAAGLGVAAVRRPRLLILAIPVIALFLGVVAPVRFVRIRFVMPAAYVMAMFAAIAISAAAGWHFARQSPEGTSPWRRRAAAVCLVLIAGWAAVRDADLTIQMLRDSRYALGDWIALNLAPGDRIGFYGAVLKLPHVPDHILLESGPYAGGATMPARDDEPEIIIIVPQQSFEIVHEWNLPAERFRELDSGEWNYDRLFIHRGPALFERRPLNWVNPPVRVYVRRDVMPRLETRTVD
jgi:4-amino-4-deoxy-L-arabinose transferase-like glycosyltransferase